MVFTRLGAFDLQLLLGTEKFHTMQFQFAYCQLPKIHYKDWVNSQNIVARTVMPLMAYSKQDRIDMLHKALQGVLNLESERSKQGKYLEFIEHYAKLTQEDAIELLRQYPRQLLTQPSFPLMVFRSRELSFQFVCLEPFEDYR